MSGLAEGRPPLRVGEKVLLRRKEGEAFLLTLASEPVLIEGVGVLDLSSALGRPEGVTVETAGRSYRVFRPTLRDLVGQMRRRSQIITAKDAQHLVYLACVGPGASVLEAGSGSGGLTLFLAWSVGPTGHVVSYDRRPEHQKVARENLRLAGLAERVTFKEKDVTGGFDERGADAVLLDLPEPWTVTPHAVASLRTGGYLATYTPTYNQLEKSVRALEDAGLEEIQSLELLQRGLHVGEGGTRPEFEMLGHTGFLAAGRKVS